jgi:DNA-binding response OmpR family regulator
MYVLPKVSDGDQVEEIGLKVLIVEDDRDCAESTATLLRLAGHHVETASNGLTAVTAVVATQFDVVLLDIGLPGMTGCDIAEWLRSQCPLNPPFLVAVTAWADEQTRRKAAACGIDLFMVKPVEPRMLVELLAGL